MPKISFPSMIPKAVGLPGFSETPWNSTSPLAAITSRIRSRSPTELPPENTSTSSRRHSSTARERSSIVSIAVR